MTLNIEKAHSLIKNYITGWKQIIFLNGPSSSGKTTIAKQLQKKLPTPYLRIGIDQLIEMMPEK